MGGRPSTNSPIVNILTLLVHSNPIVSRPGNGVIQVKARRVHSINRWVVYQISNKTLFELIVSACNNSSSSATRYLPQSKKKKKKLRGALGTGAPGYLGYRGTRVPGTRSSKWQYTVGRVGSGLKKLADICSWRVPAKVQPLLVFTVPSTTPCFPNRAATVRLG